MVYSIKNALNYSEKLKHPKWQKKRLEILKRDKFKCCKCDDDETILHIHHIEYDFENEPWDCQNEFLITLCEDCHLIVERLKNEIDFQTIKIFKKIGEDYKFIMYSPGHNGSYLTMDILNKNNNNLILSIYFPKSGSLKQLIKFMQNSLKNG